MALVRGDNHAVVAAGSALDNGYIDDIVMVSSAGEFADLAGLVCAHRLDFAAGQHAGKAGLARAASPGFGQDGGRNHRYHLFRDETHVQRPHAAVVSFASDEGAGIVSDPGHLSGPFR